MNSMHNSFSGPGGYPSGYPGYVPPPSALPYYNGYPSDLNASSNPYYAKPGAPAPQTYPSSMNNYSGAMNNSSMYYQQYGLGYQYGYGKYGIGYSEPGIHPASIGALQTPTTDLGLTGSMFSKTKYSAAPTTNTNPTSTAATTPISSSSLLSPATSNTPSPGPHGLPTALKGPEATPSPPAEPNDGKKDLDKMKRCQVCGQVFRLMSECLAHMKAAHETPHSVYNMSHHGGVCGPGSSSGASVPSAISAPRHGGMATPDSPLMALERMGWGEKQSALPLQSASSPMSGPYPQHGQQNHQVCMPHPHSGTQLYAGHPITRLTSPSQGVPSGFSSQQPPGANVSPAPPDNTSYHGSSETNIATEAVPKSKKNTCYSMSSIIGEKPVKIDAKVQNPFTVLGESSQHTEGPPSSSSPIPCQSGHQDGSGDQTTSTAQSNFCTKTNSPEIPQSNRRDVELESENAPEVNEEDQEKQDAINTTKDVDLKNDSSHALDKSSLEKGNGSRETSSHESQIEKNPTESTKAGTDSDEASLSNQTSQGSLDSSPNVQVISESTGSQTNLTTAVYPNQPIQKHAVYNQWPAGMNANVNNPYSYTPNTEGGASHSPAISTTTAGNTGSLTSGYPTAMHRFPSPYPSGNSSSGFGTPEHMIRSPGSNTMPHPHAGGWFPGSRSDSKSWANWTGSNGQSYGMYGYPAGMNSKAGVNSAPPAHHSSAQASTIHPTVATKNAVQPPGSFHGTYPTIVNQMKGSPTSTSLHERSDKEASRNLSEAATPFKVTNKGVIPKPVSMGVVKKSNSRIGPKSKIKMKQKFQTEEMDPIKFCQSPVFQDYSPACDVQSSDYSDCDSQNDNVPTLTVLKPKRRGSLGKDGAFVGPKRVKIAHQVKERQRKRHKELQEQIRQCELEEQMIAQKMEQADDQQSPLANVLLQSSILLSDKKVDGSDLVQQSIACIKAERNCSVDEDSSERELDKSSNVMNGNMQRSHFPKKTKLGHDNSVVIRDFYRPRHSKKLRAKDFKWGQYVKNNRYWCGDCAHGFKNQKESTSHTEERCKANCLYMLECYVIVKDIHSHPFYGQKVQELLEEYQVDGQHNCATCGEIFEKKSDYLVHVDSHKDFMPWECTICGTRFKIRGSLKEHLRYTHMKGRVPCLKCNKVFPTSTLLRQHVKVHTQHYKYKSGKNREEELRAAMEATAGALEPSPGVASPEENDRLSSQEANEYRSWCKLMEINAMKNIATTGASVAGVNLQLEEDDDDRNDGDSLSGDDVAGSQLDYHSLDGRGIMHS